MKIKKVLPWALMIAALGYTSIGCVQKAKEDTKEKTEQTTKQVDPLRDLANKAESLEDWEKVKDMAVTPETFNFDITIQSLYKLVKRYDSAKNYDKALESAIFAISLMNTKNTDTIQLGTDQQKLKDDFHYEIGDICSRIGKSQEMFENYFKALILGKQYGDQGIINTTGDSLYNVGKFHTKNGLPKKELSKFSGDNQRTIKKDLIFRSIRQYMSETNIKYMKPIISQIKRVSDVYGLDDEALVTEGAKEWFELTGDKPPKEKAFALKGYNGHPIINYINSAILAIK